MNARMLLNRLLAAAGYRIIKLRRFDYWFEQVVSRWGRPKFVQIGANDGIQFDDLFFKVTKERLPGAVVEPIPDLFARLVANYAAYPEVKPLQVAIHPSERDVLMYRVAPKALHGYPPWVSGIASLDRVHLENAGISESDIRVEKVPALPLMELIEKHNLLDAKILQVDAEGFDDTIIEMIDFARFSPCLIKFEVQNLPLERSTHVCDLLRRHGYRLAREGADMVAYRSS